MNPAFVLLLGQTQAYAQGKDLVELQCTHNVLGTRASMFGRGSDGGEATYIRRPERILLPHNLKLRKIGMRNAGYGIRTRELLRDRILSPAPLASLANPATALG